MNTRLILILLIAVFEIGCNGSGEPSPNRETGGEAFQLTFDSKFAQSSEVVRAAKNGTFWVAGSERADPKSRFSSWIENRDRFGKRVEGHRISLADRRVVDFVIRADGNS